MRNYRFHQYFYAASSKSTSYNAGRQLPRHRETKLMYTLDIALGRPTTAHRSQLMAFHAPSQCPRDHVASVRGSCSLLHRALCTARHLSLQPRGLSHTTKQMLATATRREAPHTGRYTDKDQNRHVHSHIPSNLRTPISSSRRRKIWCPACFGSTCHKGWLQHCASGRTVSASVRRSLYNRPSAPLGTGRTLAVGTGTCGGTAAGCSPLA